MPTDTFFTYWYLIALTLFMYTLIPTVYRALLQSAVSGFGLWIHTTKENFKIEFWKVAQHSVMHAYAACNCQDLQKQDTAEIGAIMLTHGSGTTVLEVSVSPVAAVQAKLVG